MPPLLEYEDTLSSIDTEQPKQEDDNDNAKALIAHDNDDGEVAATVIEKLRDVDCDRKSITASPTTTTSTSSSSSCSSPSVRFRDDVRVREIPRLTDEEILDCWMSRNDYTKIKQECMNIVRVAVAGGRPITASTFSSCNSTTPASSSVPSYPYYYPDLRGLENKTPCGVHRRVQNKTGAIKAVLNEQKLQLDRGIKDPDWIASVYKECSRRCSMEAKIMGMRDEIAITRDQILCYNSSGVGATNSTATTTSTGGTAATSAGTTTPTSTTLKEHGLAAVKYYSTRLEI